MATIGLVSVLTILTVVLAKDVHEMKIKHGGNFAWKNCNTTAVPFWIKSLSVSPDIIQFGSVVIVSGEIVLFESIDKPIEADISIKMSAEGQEYEMCDMIGMCHLDDVCAVLENLFPNDKPDKCPELVRKQGSNCRCPFKPNTYSVKEFKTIIPKESFTVDGTFKVVVNMKRQGREMGCMQVHFCLGKCT